MIAFFAGVVTGWVLSIIAAAVGMVVISRKIDKADPHV